VALGGAVDEGTRLDPRARRTREQLQGALLDLARERDLDEIFIGEITAAAGVNRATFYLHYADKDALLLEAMTAVMAKTAAGAAAAPVEELGDPAHPPAHTLAFFRELDEHAPLYRRVLGTNGSPVVAAHLRDGLQTAIATELDRRAPARRADGVSVELLAGFLAGGIFAAATIWLEEKRRRSPEEAAAAVWRLVSATVSALPDDPDPTPQKRRRSRG
jgi:AcrR family transcriptional regulator